MPSRSSLRTSSESSTSTSPCVPGSTSSQASRRGRGGSDSSSSATSAGCSAATMRSAPRRLPLRAACIAAKRAPRSSRAGAVSVTAAARCDARGAVDISGGNAGRAARRGDRPVLTAGAADRDREVAAVCLFVLRQPRFDEADEVRDHALDARARLEELDHAGIASVSAWSAGSQYGFGSVRASKTKSASPGVPCLKPKDSTRIESRPGACGSTRFAIMSRSSCTLMREVSITRSALSIRGCRSRRSSAIASARLTPAPASG